MSRGKNVMMRKHYTRESFTNVNDYKQTNPYVLHIAERGINESREPDLDKLELNYLIHSLSSVQMRVELEDTSSSGASLILSTY